MVERVTESVMVIGEGGSSNVVVIEGKKCLIVVDTSLFPEKAEKIKRFAKDVFGKEVGYVINTHYHPDHTFGNFAFRSSEIISSNLTKKILENLDPQYIRRVWGEDSLRKYHVVLPNVTFQDSFRETICERKITITRLGGHTPDSSVVFLEDEKILVAGDLVFNGYHPEVMEDSDIETWRKALLKMLDMMPVSVIPGHGKPSNIKSISLMREYLRKLVLFIEGNIDEIQLLKDKNFTERGFPELFESSIKVLTLSK